MSARLVRPKTFKLGGPRKGRDRPPLSTLRKYGNEMKRFFWILSLISCGGALLSTFAPRSARTAPPPPAGDFDLRVSGAVGDGVINHGPALQGALKAIANAGGGTLIVPAGH